MNLLLRIVTSVILLPLLILDVLYGGIPFALTIVAAGVIVSDEIVSMGSLSSRMRLVFLSMSTVFFMLLVSLDSAMIPFFVVWLCLFVLGVLLTFRPSLSLEEAGRLGLLTAVWLYAILGIAAFFFLRQGQNGDEILGRSFLFLALVCTIASDTFAYVVGKVFGKHPLFPLVSQKKTWEGFFGGALGCVFFPFILMYLFSQIGIDIFVGLQSKDLLILSVCIAVLAPLGDLLESRIKRAFEVKDSGGLLPGHGGLFDRIDALLVTVPFTLCYAFFLRSL